MALATTRGGWASVHPQRLVNIWAVDPKGGMELAPCRRFFTRFARGNSKRPAATKRLAQLLEDAVEVMRNGRTGCSASPAAHARPRTSRLIVVMVDELAALTA
jgi:S-DNA-T family DNA segregation ATPase FtsK/SpoIIIE